MKVLLTGATGFLGRHIIKRLQNENAEIVTVIRSTSKTDHLPKKGITYIQGNLREREIIRKAVKGVDAVIHAATSKGGPWEEFYADNVLSTENLLEEAVAQKVKRFVFLSSVAVYDHKQAKNGDIVSETFPREETPVNHYSRSKIEAENLIANYQSQRKIKTTIIRPACIYGPGGFWYPSRLGFSAGGNYAVLGNGKSIVPLSHVESVADLIWLSLTNDASEGKVYNVVEDTPVSRVQFLKWTQQVLYPKMKIIKFPHGLARFIAWGLRTGLGMVGMIPPSRLHPLALRLFAMSVFYDNEQAKTDLGWKPQKDVEQTIRDMLQWHADQKRPVSTMQTPDWPVRIQSEKSIKTVLVGSGAFAGTHLSILKNIPQVDVVAICDPNIAACKPYSDKFGINTVYTSMDEMLKDQKPDAVHILSPAQFHAEQAIKAMKAGCHVLVEKPMSVNTSEAEKMIQAAGESGKQLCMEHSNLYDGMMIQARKWINQKAIGRVIQVESWFGTSLGMAPMSPYMKYSGKDHWVYGLPGGVYQNFISHPLSCVLDVMGPVRNIKATATCNKKVPHQKSDELRLLFDNGTAIGTLSMSLCASPRYNYLNIYGDEGTIEIDFLSRTAFLNRDTSPFPKVISRNLLARKKGAIYKKAGRSNILNLITKKHGYFEGNEILIRLFYKALLDGTPMPVTHENGLESMRVMDAIWTQIEI